MSSVWLYTPPQFQMHQVMEKSLRYKVATSTTVYRIGGVWYNVLSPGMSNPDISTVDVIQAGTPPIPFLLYFNKPMVVPDVLHDGLAALVPGDPSWSAGTLTLL